MTRDELVARTRQLLAEGERLLEAPTLGGLQLWLQLSDDLLRSAWGTMDRFHMAWLSVGRPRQTVRGRPLTSTEEAGYVREVVVAKVAVLRASLDTAERGLPFVGETGGVGPGGVGPGGVGPGGVGPGGLGPGGGAAPSAIDAEDRHGDQPGELSRKVAEARREAQLHRAHRAPRPEKMQR